MSITWVVLAVVFAAVTWLALSTFMPAFYESFLVSPQKGQPAFDHKVKRSMRTFAAVMAVVVLVIFLGIGAS